MAAVPSAEPPAPSADWSELGDLGEPLGQVTRFSEPEEASAVITAAYAPHRLQVAGRQVNFDLQLWGCDVPGGVRLGYVRSASGLHLSAPPLADCYVLVFCSRGRMDVGSGCESHVTAGGAAVVVRPGDPAYFGDWSPGCQMVTARFDKAALESTMSAMLGRPLQGPIRLRLGMDLAAPSSGPFLRALRMLHSELRQPDGGMTANPVMAANLSQLVMTGLLVSQPHEFSDELTAWTRPAPPGPVRAAIEMIQAGPAEVLSVVDLAKAASVSVRALEEGFRRHVGMPPMTYLRETRLARVHEELQGSDPDVTTAAAIAQRWGFSHYGRFAAAYRSKYGIAPSQTLRGIRPI